MNSATLNAKFDDHNHASKTASPLLKSMSKVDDLDEDIHVFRVLYPTSHLPGPTPASERHHAVLDVDRMVVSASMIRKIEHELLHDACDARTVFSSCRGLAKGSQEFSEAYFAARIRSYAKHQRKSSGLIPCSPSNVEDNLLNINLTPKNLNIPKPPHPMAVNHLGHLMRHFGIWVMGLLGIQVIASWRVGAFLNSHLDGGREFYFGIVLFLLLAINSVVWFRRRGNHCNAFFGPGIALYLMAVLPIIILHVQATVLAAK